MASGRTRRAVSRLFRRLLTDPVAINQLANTKPAPVTPVPNPEPARPGTKPKVVARYLPSIFLLLLTTDELYRWRTPAGLIIAFGIWLLRIFIHLRQGAFIRKNQKGSRPLRMWVYAEAIVLAASNVLLILNAFTLRIQLAQGTILLLTAAAMAFVARCETVKIEDERKKGDPEFQSGTEWLLDCIFDETLSLRRVVPALRKLHAVPLAVNIISFAAVSVFSQWFPQSSTRDSPGPRTAYTFRPRPPPALMSHQHLRWSVSQRQVNSAVNGN